MAKEVRVPKFGMTMESVQIIKWIRTENEFVKKGEPLLEIQSDKVVIEFDSPDSGYLKIFSVEGEELKIGELLGVLLESLDEEYTIPDE